MFVSRRRVHIVPHARGHVAMRSRRLNGENQLSSWISQDGGFGLEGWGCIDSGCL